MGMPVSGRTKNYTETNYRIRKLVRTCQGAVTVGGAKRVIYLDVQPL
jgi:hypothetical protein